MQNAFMDSSNGIKDLKIEIEGVRKMIEQLDDHAGYRSAIEILFKSANRLIAEAEASDRERQSLLDELRQLES